MTRTANSVLKTAVLSAALALVAGCYVGPPPHHVAAPHPLPPPAVGPGLTVIAALPVGYVTFVADGVTYYHHGGLCYRSAPGGYMTVPAPLVPSLPVGYATIVLGGVAYYHWGGVYYRSAPGGYVVVDAPYVAKLPAGYAQVVVGGSTYYHHGGNYYLRRSGHYVVVPPPHGPWHPGPTPPHWPHRPPHSRHP